MEQSRGNKSSKGGRLKSRQQEWATQNSATIEQVKGLACNLARLSSFLLSLVKEFPCYRCDP
eukprot:3117620-Amphidinium_carterae.1